MSTHTFDAAVIFEAIKRAPQTRAPEVLTSARGRVTVTEVGMGWRIEGEGTTNYVPPRTTPMTVEVIRCDCGIKNPRPRAGRKRTSWDAPDGCDELGHPERVAKLATRILKTY